MARYVPEAGAKRETGGFLFRLVSAGAMTRRMRIAVAVVAGAEGRSCKGRLLTKK